MNPCQSWLPKTSLPPPIPPLQLVSNPSKPDFAALAKTLWTWELCLCGCLYLQTWWRNWEMWLCFGLLLSFTSPHTGTRARREVWEVCAHSVILACGTQRCWSLLKSQQISPFQHWPPLHHLPNQKVQGQHNSQSSSRLFELLSWAFSIHMESLSVHSEVCFLSLASVALVNITGRAELCVGVI